MDYKYEAMAEMMLTGIRVAKPLGLEMDFVARVLYKAVNRYTNEEDFETFVRDVALDLEMIEDEDADD